MRVHSHKGYKLERANAVGTYHEKRAGLANRSKHEDVGEVHVGQTVRVHAHGVDEHLRIRPPCAV